jgi:hypothetical protein
MITSRDLARQAGFLHRITLAGIMAGWAWSSRAFPQTTNIILTPVADAFVRAAAPTLNYGSGGGLAVAGASATNAFGTQNGAFDTFIRYSLAGVPEALDAALGTNQWALSGLRLHLQEVGTPTETMFNRGLGVFEIRWIVSDSWLEGSGKPAFPTSDGVVYQDEPSVLSPQLDVSCGQFTNQGSSGPLTFSLPVSNPLGSNVIAGADLNLYLKAVSPFIGFTFNSRSYFVQTSRPGLEIIATAKAIPTISAIEPVGNDRVAVRFTVPANSIYSVESARILPASASGDWTTVLTTPSASTNREVSYLDGTTNGATYYRLRVSP